MSTRMAWMAAGACLALASGCDDAAETGGDGGSGGASTILCHDTPTQAIVDGCPAGEYAPTAADVMFTPLGEIPAGEQLLFNDWAVPDRVLSMAPDGSNAVEIFSVYRVWSMGVSRARDKLAFSCADPDQEAHYGFNLGDAIQLTWSYDFATQGIELETCGSVNDECHHFGPGDERLYLCRRYDFTEIPGDPPSYQSTGYHVGALELGDGTFSLRLADSDPTQMFLHPEVTPDGCELWFTRISIQGGSGARSIEKLAVPGGAAEVVRTGASAAVLSPDGTRYAYADTTQQGALYLADVGGGDGTRIASANGTEVTFSPDGSRVAYLVWDDAAVCSHVEIVATDGSQADAPTRIRDCAQSGEFITELTWFTRP